MMMITVENISWQNRLLVSTAVTPRVKAAQLRRTRQVTINKAQAMAMWTGVLFKIYFLHIIPSVNQPSLWMDQIHKREYNGSSDKLYIRLWCTVQQEYK